MTSRWSRVMWTSLVELGTRRMSETFVCWLTFGPSGLIHVINRLSYK
jgi:hypothetical protein